MPADNTMHMEDLAHVRKSSNSADNASVSIWAWASVSMLAAGLYNIYMHRLSGKQCVAESSVDKPKLQVMHVTG